LFRREVTMALQKILVPYNFTAYDKKALDFLINTYLKREDVQVTLFQVYAPLPPVDLEANPEMKKMGVGMAFLSEEVRRKEEGMKSAKDFLVENGFSGSQVSYVFRERQKAVADEIIEQATKGHYHVLVLSRQSGKVSRMFARSVHARILSTLRGVTVCIPT
jgi:hypothetical protein